MRLACARAPDEDRVLCGVGERQRRQLLNQVLVDFGRAKVKPSQIPMYGKLGHVHLVAHRSHRPVRGFSLQQVLD